jgi:mutator protein MutT
LNKILFVDCCARQGSRTRRLAGHLLSHLDGDITRLELYSENIKPIDEDGIARRDGGEDEILKYARQLAEADEVVIAAPYWDLSFPSLLKVWLEQTSVVGVTFAYDEQGVPVGLCRAKRAYYVTTAGGPIFDKSYGEGYVKALFSMFGIKEFHSFTAESLDIYGADVGAIMSGAEKKIDGFFDKKRVSVAAALIWDNDRFMICQRPENKKRGLLWEFVGGKKEPGETLEQTLVRECKEELDVTVKPAGVYMSLTHEYPDLTVDLTLYNATITDGTPKLIEHKDIKWITRDEIESYDFCPADKEILKRLKNDE